MALIPMTSSLDMESVIRLLPGFQARWHAWRSSIRRHFVPSRRRFETRLPKPARWQSPSRFQTVRKQRPLQLREYCWSVLGQSGFTRTDLVIGFGGGSTTDLAGFVAATWLRGVPLIQVPTTLLAMVDAAVGGKTGINTAEGKNLVGCFYPPSLVICDLDRLATVPELDYISGLAEVIKCGFIADPQILRLIQEDPAAAARADGPHTAELVRRAVAVKADVVSGDLKGSCGRPRRGGIGREVLNYGHTWARDRTKRRLSLAPWGSHLNRHGLRRGIGHARWTPARSSGGSTP